MRRVISGILLVFLLLFMAGCGAPAGEPGYAQNTQFTYQDAIAQFPLGGMSQAEHANRISSESEVLKTEIAKLHDETLELLRRQYEASARDGNEEEFQRCLAEPYEAYYAARLHAAQEAEVYAETVTDLNFQGGTGAGTTKLFRIYVIYRNVLEELRTAAAAIQP